MKQSVDIPDDINREEVSKYDILVVASEYNQAITNKQVAVVDELLRQTGIENTKVVRVPGVFEIPLVIKWALEKNKYDAVIALGCVIRGETEHFNQIVSSCTRGIERLMMDARIPISDGVLAVDSTAQAEARIDRAKEVAVAAIKMVLLKSRL